MTLQAPCLTHSDVTDIRHVRTVIERERRFQAAKHIFQRNLRLYNKEYNNKKKQKQLKAL